MYGGDLPLRTFLNWGLTMYLLRTMHGRFETPPYVYGVTYYPISDVVLSAPKGGYLTPAMQDFESCIHICQDSVELVLEE